MNSFKAIAGLRVRFLSREEEQQLMRRYQRKGDRDAQSVLFVSVFPLMLRTAGKFCQRFGRVGDVEEFEAAAALGVLSAMDVFDPERGIRFSTYSMRAAWTQMQRELCERVIRLPRNFVHQKHCHDELEWAMQVTAIDAPDAWHDRALMVRDDDSCEDEAEQLTTLAAAVDRLPERERLVIRGYFFSRRTLASIGHEIGVSRERVRQIRNQAIDRLRESCV